MTKRDRFRLYKAVKWEAQEYYADHGYSLPKLWDIVHGYDDNASEEFRAFWLRECLIDYQRDVLEGRGAR